MPLHTWQHSVNHQPDDARSIAWFSAQSRPSGEQGRRGYSMEEWAEFVPLFVCGCAAKQYHSGPTVWFH